MDVQVPIIKGKTVRVKENYPMEVKKNKKGHYGSRQNEKGREQKTSPSARLKTNRLDAGTCAQ